MITEDFVSFETAKLLKEEGFDEECRAFYVKSKECGIELFPSSRSYNYNDDDYPRISAPTLQLAMKWLREVHNFHIMVDCIGAENYIPTIQFTWSSQDIEIKSKTSKIGGNGFDSYEQACEAAIKYCLENLI